MGSKMRKSSWKQPEGFISAGQEHLVCKLKKALYGLKQASRCWNAVLDEFLKTMQFSQSSADQCVYTRNHKNGKTIWPCMSMTWLLCVMTRMS